MARPKSNDFPAYMTPDGDRGGFVVRNPLTGKRRRFSDEGAARRAARLLADYLDIERQAKTLDDGRPTVAALVDAWLRDKPRFMPWKPSTRTKMLQRMARIHKELGSRPVHRTDCLFLEEWLSSFCETADAFNKWRYALVLLWRYAMSRKLADTNEPERIEERSTSKKLEANQKRRGPLDVAGFKAIHDRAPAWLQLAMEQSLITLQARNEICHMKHTDYRDGHLFVIRAKVSGESDMAFIKIALTGQLEDIRHRSLTLDGLTHPPSSRPYLVHRAPQKNRRAWREGKPHWSFVNPEYLSKAFAKARDEAGRWTHLAAPERPTFHEIRGLGSRLYKVAGMPDEQIQALMTHSNPRTTQIYLDGGRGALTSNDYVAVRAPMTLMEVLK